MARVQYSLICLDRMAKFTVDRARDWIAPELSSRLQTVSSDITSLVQFAEALVSRVELLQDAASRHYQHRPERGDEGVDRRLGHRGIPPVVVVGIYGINFKNMPELNWTWGYPYALVLVLISALLPLIWFKWKNWI